MLPLEHDIRGRGDVETELRPNCKDAPEETIRDDIAIERVISDLPQRVSDRIFVDHRFRVELIQLENPTLKLRCCPVPQCFDTACRDVYFLRHFGSPRGGTTGQKATGLGDWPTGARTSESLGTSK